MRKLLTSALLALVALAATAKDYTLNTPNSSLIITAIKEKPLYFRYYGSRAEAEDVRAAGRMVKYEAYPAFGTHCSAPYAALV